jgi:septal ring factor EnvC (AmiA/AmiB activator)
MGNRTAIAGEGRVNIDERLEKLAERHEALAQTVEMMAREGARLQKLVETHEKRFEWLREDSIAMKDRIADLQQDIARRELREEAARRGKEIDERIDKLVSAIGKLAETRPPA